MSFLTALPAPSLSLAVAQPLTQVFVNSCGRLIFKLFPKRYKCSTRKRELFIMQLYNQHGEPRAGETSWYFIRNLYKFQVYGISEGRVCKWLRMSSCKLHTVYIYIYIYLIEKNHNTEFNSIYLLFICVCVFFIHFISSYTKFK